ncbi:carbonic anhydrase [Rhodopseudomonas palustris]|uniref:Carbonic anhydrase n=1 Tax=Rhodopseudomonas palustris (strain BisB18) TaxID=316056 RepID=Q21CS7_RHOPB
MASFPQHLLKGYRNFTTQRLPTEQSRYRELSERGQAPEVMVIGCCDSRVSPEVIFDAGPGELFVLRNVANLVPVYAPDGAVHGVSAALEYAVQVLRVKHIVVLGHAQCGGIRAFVDKTAPLSPGDFIGKWMAMFARAAETVEQRDQESMQEFITRLEQAAVKRSLDNLMTFPCIKILAERGKLQLHGAYFGVAEGSLAVWDAQSGQFHAASELAIS